MAHFICTGGCKGVAQEPTSCASSECSKYEQPLIPCNCTDDQHGNFSQQKEEGSQDSSNQ